MHNKVISLQEWCRHRCLHMAKPLAYTICTPRAGAAVTFYDNDMHRYRDWPTWLACYREMKKLHDFLERLTKTKVRM